MSSQPKEVGIRELRENLSSILLDSTEPVSITRHGDPVGVYLPRRRKWTEEEKESFFQGVAKLQEEMAKAGITEEDIIADFEQLRAEERKNRK
jgi:antitoxin (DNA-binding transcriptional repressor) of toxin-antitoxin stability system